MPFTSSMKTAWLLMVVSSWVVPSTEAQPLADFINQLLAPYTQVACDYALASLGLDSTLDCTCEALFKGVFQGLEGEFSCVLDEERCLVPPDLYCATGSINATFDGGFLVETGFDSNVKACFTVKSGLPNNVLSINDICFTFVPSGLTLESCSASIGTEPCTSCEICESGVDFKFNCSNVDLLPDSPAFFVPGPSFETCIGLSLIPTNTTVRV